MDYKHNLKELRDEVGLKQEYVAKKMHISSSYLSGLESYNKRMSLDNYVKALEVLGYKLVIKKKDGEEKGMTEIQKEKIEKVNDQQSYSNIEVCEVIRQVKDSLKDIDYSNFDTYSWIIEEALQCADELDCSNVYNAMQNLKVNLNKENNIGKEIEDFVSSLYYVTKYSQDFYKVFNEAIPNITTQVSNIKNNEEIEELDRKDLQDIYNSISKYIMDLVYDLIIDPYELSLIELWDDMFCKSYAYTKEGKKVTLMNFVYEYYTLLVEIEDIDMEKREFAYDNCKNIMEIDFKTGKLIVKDVDMLEEKFDEDNIRKIKESLIEITSKGFDLNNKIGILIFLQENFNLLMSAKDTK